MDLAHAATWSGRPDPLLMGGDNDRAISQKLFHTALAWDYLQPLFDDEDRRTILSKVDEYLQKIYDFTLLQRAYMGCPSIDPHSLGSWNGAAVACMAFYQDLEIARHALPLFHGLFTDSLKLFPASGKAAWATYFPFHLVLYLAAAHTFGGVRPELSSSLFLDNLGQALQASFEAPNSQEMQRGLRTREHRFLTAFLCRFHPTPGIEAIYRAFAEKEQKATGNVVLGIFDLLYAPDASGDIATFPDRPLFAKDVGDIIVTACVPQSIALAVSAGPKAGRNAIFTLMPHNREFPPSLGAIDVKIDGVPVLCNINMGVYGLDSALTNTMCFEGGGALTNGQYLNGAVPPESCSIIRRCLVGERFLYAHIVITQALDPGLKVRRADRIIVFDRKTGIILLSDAFEADRPIRFATHLHCSGTAHEEDSGVYRLTGGQANLIAGIKSGSKGLDDNEKGEIFVHLLRSDSPTRVVIEEPKWIPGYIYGLNNTGQEDIKEGRFPRYKRWRLEVPERATHGAFLVALTPQSGQVRMVDGTILLPQSGKVRLGPGRLEALGTLCDCECLMADEVSQKVTALGLRSLKHGNDSLGFATPVDVEYCVDTGDGKLYAQGSQDPEVAAGFNLGSWNPIAGEGWKTLNRTCATFRRFSQEIRNIKDTK
jgi:hypothetical protein